MKTACGPGTPAPRSNSEAGTSEQFHEKWKPVFRLELRKNKDLEGSTDAKNRTKKS